MTMTWKNGRQLATLQDSDDTISYEYDSSSIRTSKTIDGVKHTYAYLGGKLMYETRGNAKFYYSYDANGILYSVKYTLTDTSAMQTYFFTHNSRGDIIGIYDSNGTQQVKYDYDAWGNILSITDSQGNAITDQNHIANLNPFRYRGYYYDSETGLYYLMSRYYDPVTHRFINADGYFQSGNDILDANMSAYCRNNPIRFVDPTGTHACGDPTCTRCREDRRTFINDRTEFYNRVTGKNVLYVEDDGDFVYNNISSYSDALSLTIEPIFTFIGEIPNLTSVQTTTVSAISTVPITALNIADTCTNPYLTSSQKGIVVAEEIFFAAGNIALAYAITNFWNPTGWVAMVACIGTVALSAGASLCISKQVTAFENENKTKGMY